MKYALTFIISAIFAYLIFGFVNLEFNVVEMSEGMRYWIVFFPIITTIAHVMFSNLDRLP